MIPYGEFSSILLLFSLRNYVLCQSENIENCPNLFCHYFSNHKNYFSKLAEGTISILFAFYYCDLNAFEPLSLNPFDILGLCSNAVCMEEKQNAKKSCPLLTKKRMQSLGFKNLIHLTLPYRRVSEASLPKFMVVLKNIWHLAQEQHSIIKCGVIFLKMLTLYMHWRPDFLQ